jgi:hypothetical protein
LAAAAAEAAALECVYDISLHHMNIQITGRAFTMLRLPHVVLLPSLFPCGQMAWVRC